MWLKIIIIKIIQDLDKQAFQEAKKLNSKNCIKFNIPNNYFYQEDILKHLLIITKKGETKKSLDDIGINKFGAFIKKIDDSFFQCKLIELYHALDGKGMDIECGKSKRIISTRIWGLSQVLSWQPTQGVIWKQWEEEDMDHVTISQGICLRQRLDTPNCLRYR